MSRLATDKALLDECSKEIVTPGSSIVNIPSQYASPSYRCHKCGVRHVILWHAILGGKDKDCLSCTKCAAEYFPRKRLKFLYNTADNFGPLKPAIWDENGNYYPGDCADSEAIKLWQTLPISSTS